MKTITIDFISYQLETWNIKHKANAIHPEINDKVETGSCKDILLVDYIERLEKMSELMRLYQRLTDRDAVDISKAGISMKQQDEVLAGR